MKSLNLVLFLFIGSFCYSQESIDSLFYYETKLINGAVPVIDGLENDEVWKSVPWSTDPFTQRTPKDGIAPTQPTNFKVLYDLKNIYFLIRCFDDEPDKIVKRMSRRDGFEGDFVEVNIDSYSDKRTAFSFTASVSGVKGDEYISNNGENWDGNWDPIWYLKTSVDQKGWIAEFKIPLSQLRFADKPVHQWGLQFTRRFFRNEERSNWQPVPQNASGWVHRFGKLIGIKGIKPQKQLEIQPYIVAKTERFEKVEGNPFVTGKNTGLNGGLDAKIGLTSDITLDLTVNPDFGQVEADPSQVNLGAFQVFFREQRPFFIEGNNVLDFRISNSQAGGPFTRDNLFYSRRIGGNPHHYPENIPDNAYVKQPDNTTILGAAKITGKNAKGFSWGILESVTATEFAVIDSLGTREEELVEPQTNFLIARAQQDIRQGKTVIGFIGTATNRKINEEHLEFLHKSAYSGGIDITHYWKNREYGIKFNSLFSHVRGSEEAILATQTSSERYYQRPDFKNKFVDENRTGLTGSGGSISLGKSAGSIIFQSGITYRSPGLELNDAGFIRSANNINQWTWAQYRIQEPFSIFRSFRLNVNQYLAWDFDAVNTYRALNFNAHVQFKNFWRFGNGATLEGENVSNADLRGGPSLKSNGGKNYWYYLESDNRKKIIGNFNQWFYWGDKNASESYGFDASVSYQPLNALRTSLSLNSNWGANELQYISTVDNDGVDQYLVARIDRKSFSLSLRINYNINPNLSIQYWGQPFAFIGNYSKLKVITNSTSDSYENRFHEFADSEINLNELNEYEIDSDNDGLFDYTVDNPDFNFAEFRSNMVMRWEYKPGSILFLVWTQGQSAIPFNTTTQSGVEWGSDSSVGRAHNILLLKYTYRFLL